MKQRQIAFLDSEELVNFTMWQEEKANQCSQICEWAMCDPTEQIYKAPAACEGLLPNHCQPVTPDDLSPQKHREEQESEIPKQ